MAPGRMKSAGAKVRTRLQRLVEARCAADVVANLEGGRAATRRTAQPRLVAEVQKGSLRSRWGPGLGALPFPPLGRVHREEMDRCIVRQSIVDALQIEIEEAMHLREQIETIVSAVGPGTDDDVPLSRGPLIDGDPAVLAQVVAPTAGDVERDAGLAHFIGVGSNAALAPEAAGSQRAEIISEGNAA